MGNIIFCADGTWNTADDPDGITNVEKIFKALVQSEAQTAKHDDGVGTDGTEIQRLLGGAIGEGLFQKIKDGYDYITQEHKEGDIIYLFGFSRGAYTARSLAGMIATCGLPSITAFNANTTQETFNAYRDPNREVLLTELNKKYNYKNVTIKMVGVWDTVGSLGIPGNLFENFDHTFYGFLDTGLHPNIKSAYHALAIDEHRNQFPATLWEPEINPDQELKQVWFAGVHADVGGGYLETELSDIALSWMMRMAKANGVLFNDKDFKLHTCINDSNALAEAHKSWSIKWGFQSLRDVDTNVRPDMAISSSVSLRWKKLPDYRPPNCTHILDSGGLLLAEEDVFLSEA